MKNMSLKTLVMIAACSIVAAELKAMGGIIDTNPSNPFCNDKNLTTFKNEKGELVVALKASRSGDEEEFDGSKMLGGLALGAISGVAGGAIVGECYNRFQATGGVTGAAVLTALVGGAAYTQFRGERENAVANTVGRKYLGASGLTALSSAVATFLWWTKPDDGKGGGAAGAHARH